MENLFRLALFALSEFRPAERFSAGASRITAAAVFSAAAVVLLVSAFVCLIAAAWIALIPIVGPALAALSAAAGLAVVAAVLWALAKSRFSHDDDDDRRKPDPLAGLTNALHGPAAEGLAQEARRLWGENKIPMLLAAVVAGMALGGRDEDDRAESHRRRETRH